MADPVSPPGDFAAAERAFDAVHREDPRAHGGEPFAVAYHRVLARWVDAIAPEASVAMRLAARAQHLGRHRVPRASFPEGVLGYKKWRATLAQQHAAWAREALVAAGYDDATCERTADFLTKKRLGSDPEVQRFEDAICLTFLELEYADFSAKHGDDEVVTILQKTWGKMTDVGHAHARALGATLTGRPAALLARALGG